MFNERKIPCTNGTFNSWTITAQNHERTRNGIMSRNQKSDYYKFVINIMNYARDDIYNGFG